MLDPGYMTQNHLRPCLGQQDWLIKAINELGFNPVDKPIHLFSADDVELVRELWEQVREVSQ